MAKQDAPYICDMCGENFRSKPPLFSPYPFCPVQGCKGKGIYDGDDVIAPVSGARSMLDPLKGYRKYDPKEGYEKKEYDIVLKSGKEIIWTWPNAGKFIWLEDGETTFPESQVAYVRPSIKAKAHKDKESS